ITGTIISTNAGAAVFIGWMGLGFTVGFSGYFKFALVAYFFSLLLVILFAKPLRRQKLFTLADLFTARFGGRTGMVPSLISAFVYSVPTLALQLIGMSTVFNITLGWGTGPHREYAADPCVLCHGRTAGDDHHGCGPGAHHHLRAGCTDSRNRHACGRTG